MAEVVLKLRTDFEGASARATNAVQRISNGMQKLRAKVATVGRRVSASFTKMRQSINETAGAFAKSRLLQLASASALIGVIGKSLQLAAQQEVAENNVAAALAKRGLFTAKLNQQLQQQAIAMQKVSIFGDEAILETQALLLTFGATEENLKSLTQGTLDYAAATGKNLEEAVRQVGKTLGGYGGELLEVLPGMKELTSEQLKAGKAADELAKVFGGRALQATTTISGQMQMLGNSVNGVLTNLGLAIFNTEAFGISMDSMNKTVEESTTGFDAVSEVLDNLFIIIGKIGDAFTIAGKTILRVSSAILRAVNTVRIAFNKLTGDEEEVLDIREQQNSLRVFQIQLDKERAAAIESLLDTEVFGETLIRREVKKTTKAQIRAAELEKQARIQTEQQKRNAIQQTMNLQRQAAGAASAAAAGGPGPGFQFAGGTARTSGFFNPETGETKFVQNSAGGINLTINSAGVVSGDPRAIEQFGISATDAVTRNLNNNASLSGANINRGSVPNGGASNVFGD